jgi:hypothetical protein
MSNPTPTLYRKHLNVTTVGLDRDGLAASQHTTANVAMTLNGALSSGGTYTAGDGIDVRVGHLIGVYSSANISSDIFTIVGTDPDGIAQTETVTGVNASTVFTTKYFYTVTSVKNDTTEGTNNVEVGIGSTLATQRIPIEARSSGWKVGCGLTVPSGTISVTLQATMDDIYDSSVTPLYISDGTFATKTGTFFYDYPIVVTAVRFITASYTGAVSTTFHVLQNK